IEHPLPSRLLRRHVLWCAERLAGAPRETRSVQAAGDTKVEKLDLLERPAHQKHIARFDVAMDDPLSVGKTERFGNAPRTLDAVGTAGGAVGNGQWPAVEPLVEILSLEPLHGEVELPGVRSAVRHVPNDVSTAERTQDLGFTDEAARTLRVGRL